MAAPFYAPEGESLASVYAGEAPHRREELANWRGRLTPEVRLWTYVFDNLDLMDAVTTLQAHVAPRGGPGFDVGGFRFALVEGALRPLEISSFLYDPRPPHQHSPNVIRFMTRLDIQTAPRGFFTPFPEQVEDLLGTPWLPGLMGLGIDPESEAAYVAHLVFEVANTFERSIGQGLQPALVEFLMGRFQRNRARLSAILQGSNEAQILQPFLPGTA